MGTIHFTNLTVVTGATPPVSFEPCSEFRDDAAVEGSCAGCGWLADDHDAMASPTAEAA
jgi:hypothetical protein